MSSDKSDHMTVEQLTTEIHKAVIDVEGWKERVLSARQGINSLECSWSNAQSRLHRLRSNLNAALEKVAPTPERGKEVSMPDFRNSEGI
jgi:ribosome biogenesis protein Tsr3